MKRIELDERSYEIGYIQGQSANGLRPEWADGLSFWSGYIEGKAEREKGCNSDRREGVDAQVGKFT